uniref:Uncharacterized protein n=1 Tax=Arundo donax TaxID=35708 RepID=A0A0A8Y6P7_ARUDO
MATAENKRPRSAADWRGDRVGRRSFSFLSSSSRLDIGEEEGNR